MATWHRAWGTGRVSSRDLKVEGGPVREREPSGAVAGQAGALPGSGLHLLTQAPEGPCLQEAEGKCQLRAQEGFQSDRCVASSRLLHLSEPWLRVKWCNWTLGKKLHGQECATHWFPSRLQVSAQALGPRSLEITKA